MFFLFVNFENYHGNVNGESVDINRTRVYKETYRRTDTTLYNI